MCIIYWLLNNYMVYILLLMVSVCTCNNARQSKEKHSKKKAELPGAGFEPMS